jgi:hypothetical protein
MNAPEVICSVCVLRFEPPPLDSAQPVRSRLPNSRPGRQECSHTRHAASRPPTSATTGLRILLGRGDGTFTQGEEFTFDAPVNLPAVADLRNNGDLDIVVPEGGSVQVLLGNGNGTFAVPVTYTTPPIFAGAVVLADFNGDGKEDSLPSDPFLGP